MPEPGQTATGLIGDLAMGMDANNKAQHMRVGPGGGLRTDDTVGDYETVAASQTAQVLGGAGAIGDYISGLIIIPATTSPGSVQIKDGAGSNITVFTGGATSVADLKPFFVTLAMRSAAGAWAVTTGANVSAIAVGDFT